MPYIKETCVAGNTIEIRKYYAPRYKFKGEHRMKRKHPTPKAVEKANRRKAERDLRLLMNENFDKKSWSITLTFSRAPATIRELQNRVANYVRRLRTTAKRKNTEIKYIYVLGAGPRRRHAHMLVSGLTCEELTEAWTEGHISSTKVYTDNLRELAAYFIKNAEETRAQAKEEGLTPRRWNASRNLRQPKRYKKVVAAKTYRTDIRVPSGYYTDKDSIYEGISSFTGLPFFEYTLIRLRGGPE